MISFLLLFVSSSLGILWSSIFLITGIFGIHIYKINGLKQKQFHKKITIASIWENGDPDHWIVGKWFIGYIFTNTNNHGNSSKTIYVITTKRFYKKEIEMDDTDISSDCKDKKEKGSIKMLEREGHYYYMFYTPRNIKVTKHIERDYQSKIVNEIIGIYEKKDYVVSLISGPPNNGKSMIPLFIAKKLAQEGKKVSICDTFNPTEPGDSFGGLYSKVNPSTNEPLILVLEEVDILIMKIIKGLEPHKNIPIQIRGKPDWNTFLDRFDRGLYGGVIIVMTTNKPLDFFDALDESLLRDGRVNYRCVV